MRKAIKTQYKPVTNTQPSRIVASAEGGLRATVAYDHAYDAEENHRRAMLALVAKMGWKGDFVGGGFGTHYVWVDDDGRLKALKGMVNDIRKASWSGNPWCKPPFRVAALTIANSLPGWRGNDATSAPTTEEEIQGYMKAYEDARN